MASVFEILLHVPELDRAVEAVLISHGDLRRRFYPEEKISHRRLKMGGPRRDMEDPTVLPVGLLDFRGNERRASRPEASLPWVMAMGYIPAYS